LFESQVGVAQKLGFSFLSFLLAEVIGFVGASGVWSWWVPYFCFLAFLTR
jgi:hypothetical protein